MNLSVPLQAPREVRSFSPNGGQSYGANLFGGFLLLAGAREYTFFDISEASAGVYSRFLTNLKEANKIGSSMNYVAVQFAPRIMKLDGTAITADEMAALVLFLAGSRIELYIGSNDTRVAEYDGSHFLNIISGAVVDAGGVSTATPINQTSWVSLPQELLQGLEPNCQILGRVYCNVPGGTPAALSGVGGAPLFAFKWLLAGAKTTK